LAGRQRTGTSKAWMNQTLENNPVPTVWVSNAIGQMDEAYLRRFSLHIAFKHPPVSVRKRLATQAFAPLGVSEPFISNIAALEQLAPAHLASAAKLAQLIAPSDAAATEALLRTQLTAARTAMGMPLHSQQRSSPVAYDPRFVRLQGNVTAVDMIAALQRKGDTARAALCFWGQPGTGKTELAHHIAAVLGRELVVKTASDLLSMWLGEAEKNVAAMFNDAAERHSEVVLLLDEADSLLRDRAKASARHEGSITNEFLKQMEHYPGIFICTTNLFADLDPAVLRRFQFRLEFLALTGQQARELYVHSFEQALSDEGILTLAKAPDLVPADFANVKRQMQFMDAATVEAAVIAQLAAEAKTRKGESAGERRGMGFV
jgi:ATPase family associated with various cellular activities (AAA)